jgi:hypothetical protein
VAVPLPPLFLMAVLPGQASEAGSQGQAARRPILFFLKIRRAILAAAAAPKPHSLLGNKNRKGISKNIFFISI